MELEVDDHSLDMNFTTVDLEQHCVICLDSVQKDLVKLKACCPIVIHKKCLSKYLNNEKKCIICHKDISHKVIKKTNTEFNLLYFCNMLLWLYCLTTFIMAIIIYNDIDSNYNNSSYGFALSAFIGVTLLFSISLCSHCDFIFVPKDFSRLIIPKYKKYHYLYILHDDNSIVYQNLPYEPYRLFQSQFKSRLFVIIIFYVLPLILISIANSFMIFYTGSVNAKLLIFACTMWSSGIIPLLYLVICPLLFMILYCTYDSVKCCCFVKKSTLSVSESLFENV